MIQNKKYKLDLNKNQTIFLITSCISQLFIFGINININSIYNDIFKLILAFLSFSFFILTIYNIFCNTELNNRLKLLLKILYFFLGFNLVIILSSRYLGGVITFLIGIIYLKLLINIK